MALKTYKSGAWQDITTLKTYKDGAWQEADHTCDYRNGAWEKNWENFNTEVLPYSTTREVVASTYNPSLSRFVGTGDFQPTTDFQTAYSKGYTKVAVQLECLVGSGSYELSTHGGGITSNTISVGEIITHNVNITQTSTGSLNVVMKSYTQNATLKVLKADFIK